jgi:hypothetical protein
MLNKWKSSLTMESPFCRGLRGVALVLATLILVTNAEARPRHECTQDNLEGAYGYAFTGPLVGVGPVAAVGLASFDGEGGLTAKDTVSTNGKIVRRTGRGTYVVNANCTGSAKIGDDFGEFMFNFMIIPDSGGPEFSFIVTNQGTVQTGVALKTGDDECSDASLKGTYRVLGAGTNIGVALIGAVGFRVLDGAGNLTQAEDTFSSNGTISHRIGRSATYIVKADCTVTEVFEDGLTFDGVIVAGGREAYFVRTNPGTAITALYKKQSLHHDD